VNERLPEPGRVRHYYYVSPRKIVHIGDQIQPSNWQKLREAIAGFDVKAPGGFGVGVTLTAADDRPEATPLGALQAVFKELHKEHHIHALDENAIFLHGVLDMYSAVMTDPRTRTKIAIWIGATQQSLIALGGSLENTWGGGSDQPRSESTRPPVLEPEVFQSLKEADDAQALVGQEPLKRKKTKGSDADFYVSKLYSDWQASAAAKSRYEVLMWQERRTPYRRSDQSRAEVVIGSPLFVAAAV
jgi:Family of unknown function (DUF7019)